MIKKIYRLNENEIKKVLKNKKPFFSYGIVANTAWNRLPYSRFWIIISWKVCKTAVSRNFFRRRFYDKVCEFINSGSYDIVFTIKKWKVFDKKDSECIVSFDKDMDYVLKNIFIAKKT